MVSCLEMFFIANYATDYYPFLLLGWFIFGVSGSIFIFIGSCYSIVVQNFEQTRLSTEKTVIIKNYIADHNLNKFDDSVVRKTTRLAIVQSTVPLGVGF